MKISAVTTICNCIYYLVSVRCSESEITTFEGLKLHDNEPFFSFDKETFNDFEFELTDEVLSHMSLSKLPSDEYNPLENFLETFLTFFKYSKIKHDDELKRDLSNFFEVFYKGDDFYGYSKVNLDNYSEMLSVKVEKILKEKDLNKQPVLIEEVNGRIICKLNYSYKPCKDKKSFCADTFFKDEAHKNTVDFFFRFSELYLIGFFKNDLLNSLDNLNEEYFKKMMDPNLFVSKEFDQELFDYYFNGHQKYLAANVSNSEDESRKTLEIPNGNWLWKYGLGIIKRYFAETIPKYLLEIEVKVAAKVFFYMSENERIFRSFSEKEKETVPLLKEQFKKNLERKNLSNASIDYLLIRCLEVEVY